MSIFGPKTSKWIKFLRQYGPIPSNDNMYDEAIQRATRRTRIEPLRFDADYLDELVDNFKSEAPKSVILTGTAGDGKTFYCRQVWEALGGSIEEWELGYKIQKINVGNKTLHVIKDLSELSTKERGILRKFADAVVGSCSEDIFLIAANDGQLLEALKTEESSNLTLTKQCIEDLLVSDRKENSIYRLRLYNLSRINAAKMFPRILESVLGHPGWQECNNCLYRDALEYEKKCPIWENKKRLQEGDKNNITISRMIDLLTLCDIGGMHLPIRQLLILVVNTLLGHPDAKDRLLTCQEVHRVIGEGSQSLASLYRNFFGENLSERKREATDAFVILNNFGIGHETSNRIDNILIFGNEDVELRPHYETLVLSDKYYGADYNFEASQRAYLEGTMILNGKPFLDLLKSQRQRLFFTIPKEQEEELGLWHLTIFHNAGEFLEVYRKLQNGRNIPKTIVSRLVRGFNRISTGLLVNNQDQLILATSAGYSQAKICRILEEFVSVPPRRGESVFLELDPQGRINFVVSLSSTVQPVKLLLQIVRYEFLCRVAEGALPSSFSRECYEDILAFKTRLLRQLDERRKIEGEERGEDQFRLYLLNIDTDGMARESLVEVYF